MKFNFCEKCGCASKDVFAGWYSKDTGEAQMRSVCSADPCHTKHDERRQSLFGRGDWKCSRCGKTGYWYP